MPKRFSAGGKMRTSREPTQLRTAANNQLFSSYYVTSKRVLNDIKDQAFSSSYVWFLPFVSVFLCVASPAYWQEMGERNGGGAKSYDGETKKR